MYPYLKLFTTLAKARFRPKLNAEDQSVLHLGAGLTDIDPFLEMNNARYFIYMELGRWDYAYRVGFMPAMKERRWGFAVGGASVRFRRRIRMFQRFTLTTELVCDDGRWFYFLQETHRSNQICSSALIKAGITSQKGLVPISEVLRQLDREDWRPEMPSWVRAWIEAESRRPWPS